MTFSGGKIVISENLVEFSYIICVDCPKSTRIFVYENDIVGFGIVNGYPGFDSTYSFGQQFNFIYFTDPLKS
jgi:hypothetical protein